MNETGQLARHATSIDVATLPSAIIDKTKQHILDTVGVIIRAQYACESSKIFADVTERMAGPHGTATVVGANRLFPAHYAALLHGAYAHSIEFDDTHGRGSIHPGATVVPAALAVAEDSHASGAALIAGVVAGYEIACRVSMPLPPTLHLNRGFHPTATCGTFGAAAAAGILLGVSPGTLENAWGLCGSMASGSMQCMEDSSWNKRFHSGMAAHNGILGLNFANAGALGAKEAFEGRRGFWFAYGQSPIPERSIEDLGAAWMIAETGFKPYPTCRSTHSPINSIIDLVTSEDIAPDEIDSMHVGLSIKGVDLVGSPEDRKRVPVDHVDAPFSMHWTAAVAATKRRMGWSQFDLIHDADVLALANRVTVAPDADCEALWPGRFASLVSIKARGREYRRFVEDAKGDSSFPMSWHELETKFHDLAEERLTLESRLRIIDVIHRLDTVGVVSELTSHLRP